MLWWVPCTFRILIETYKWVGIRKKLIKITSVAVGIDPVVHFVLCPHYGKVQFSYELTKFKRLNKQF